MGAEALGFECCCPRCGTLTIQRLPALWRCECGSRLQAALAPGRRGGMEVWTWVDLRWIRLHTTTIETEAL